MASSNSNTRYQPTGRFQVSYKSLNETTANPNSATIRDRTQKDYQKDPLSRYNQWPLNAKPKNKKNNKAKTKFIERDKTTRKAAIRCLNELKINYFSHTLHNTVCECPKNQTVKLEDYFFQDKFGLKKIPQTDTLCWRVRKTVITASASATTASASSATSTLTAKKSGKKKGKKKKKKKGKSVAATASSSGSDDDKLSAGWTSGEEVTVPTKAATPSGEPIVQVMVKTDFYKALQVLQDEYYRWIRGSINRWMDKSAWNYLQSKIELREQTDNIKLEERADPDKRVRSFCARFYFSYAM